MVDIVVRGGNGVPEGAYISVRIGDVRRQMHFKPGSRFRFDHGAAAMRNFSLDVFEKVGSKQVGFGELHACGATGRKEGTVEVARSDGGDPMSLDLELLPLGGRDLDSRATSRDESEACKSLRQQAASQARGYLQGHAVQRLLHGMVQSLLEEQPEDPLVFMSRYMQDAVVASRPGTRATTEAMPGHDEVPPEVAGREHEAQGRGQPSPASELVRNVEAAARAQDAAEASCPPRDSPGEKQLAGLQEATSAVEADEEEEEEEEEDDDDDDDDPLLRGFPTQECPERLPDLRQHHSLAARVLKRDPAVYDRLKGLRTRMGSTLARCIKPGMDIRGHPLLPMVGAVAGDEKCYETFADLFDPIIADLNGLASPSLLRHEHDMDPTKVTDALIDPSGKHVMGVSIRACRNLSGFRMSPACSLQERRKVEQLIVGAFLTSQTALRGTYYPLEGSESWPARALSSEDAAWLAKEKLQFYEPDSDVAFLSGFANEWPDARGIFIAHSRKFVAWINEEDHLCYTVLDPGGDLKKAFALAMLAHDTVQEFIAEMGHSYCHSQRLGFLGTSPAKLGTCMVAAAALKLPHLGPHRAALDALCKELGVRAQPLPTEGQPLTAASSCFELGLHNPIGATEVEQVDRVIKAGRSLLALEKRLERGEHVNLQDVRGALAERRAPGHVTLARQDTAPPIALVEQAEADASAPADDAGRCVSPDSRGAARPGMVHHAASLDSLASSVAALPEELPDLSRHHSHLAAVLAQNPSVYERLRDVRTASGVSLARCVKPGMDVCTHPLIKTVGVVAGDAECYETFREVMEPVVAAIHPGWAPEALQPSSLDCDQVSSIMLDPSGDHVRSARVSLRRNIEGLKFSPACSLDERLEASRILTKAAGLLPGDLRGEYHPFEGISTSLQQELLREELLMQEPDSMAAAAAGVARGWPEARGIFVSGSKELVAWINEEEHLRLWSIDRSGNLKAAFGALCAAEASLREALRQDGRSFARSPHLGYLTACPSHVGTTLRAEVRVHIPLLDAEEGFHACCQRLGVRVCSAHGGGDLIISNAETLGTGEAEQVNAVLRAVRTFVELEEKLDLGEKVDLSKVASPGQAQAAQ